MYASMLSNFGWGRYFFVPALFFLVSCGTSIQDHASDSSIKSEKKILSFYDEDFPTPYHQLGHDGKTLYVQTQKNRIYEVFANGEYELFYDLNESITYESLFEMVKTIEMTENLEMVEEKFRTIQLHNFFISEDYVYISPMIQVQEPGIYDGASAIYITGFTLLLALDTFDMSIRFFKSLTRPKNEENGLLGNSLTSRLGFTVQDSILTVRNLLRTDSALGKPELIRANLFDSEPEMHFEDGGIYYDNIGGSLPLTIQRGFFYGEGRTYYSGTSGMYTYNSDDHLYEQIPTTKSEEILLTREGVLDHGTWRVDVKKPVANQTSVNFRLNDSLIYRDSLPVLRKIYAVDISKDMMVWVVYRDSTNEELCLKTFKLG